MNRNDYEHSRPLDVHRWSDHPEVNTFVDDIFNTFFKKKTEFFDYLDKMLDDDLFRFAQEFRSIERAKELSDNEDKMIVKLNEKLK